MLYNKAIGATASAQKVYIEEVFQTFLYAGNGSTQTITNGIDLTGKGGLVWTKSRSNASSHALFDTNRGISKSLSTNSTATEEDYGNPPSTAFAGILSFDSSGYTLGNDGFAQLVNVNGRTYTSWTFRKAAKFFGVVTYTGNGTAGKTISHNLGSVPGCIIVKRTDSTGNWNTYHRSLGANQSIVLNTTGAAYTSSGGWNDTTPTSSVFTVGSDSSVNANGGTYVAYLFAHDAGGFGDSGNDNVISCGSYTGNGSTSGPIVTLGWEPQWLLIKQASGPNSWFLYDNVRGVTTGGNDSNLIPNQTDREDSLFDYLDFNSSGFQLTTSSGDHNTSGGTYIYIAIRRGPMKTPTDATKVFKAVTQTSQGTVSTAFPVDMVIMGDRSSTWGYNWSVQDRLRGKSAVLFTSATTAENTTSLSTFDSNTSFKDGWVSGGTSAVYETFRRAPGFFDVVAYSGGGTSKDHNLGVKPELAFIKVRSASSRNWIAAIQGGTGGYLNTSDPINASNLFVDLSNATSTTFPINGNPEVGQSGQTYIAYLFATCPGVSKVGSYTGSGTTKQIDCGFTNGSRFVLIKRTDSTGDWYVWDTARGIVSANDPYLLLNSTAAEVTNTDYIDPLSSGFEISSTAPAAINANGGSFVFLAIA